MNQVKAVRLEAGGRMGVDVIIFVTYWNTHTFTIEKGHHLDLIDVVMIFMAYNPQSTT